MKAGNAAVIQAFIASQLVANFIRQCAQLIKQRTPPTLSSPRNTQEAQTVPRDEVQKAGANMFFSASTCEIDCVDIEIEIICDVSAHHSALEKMHIIKMFNKLGGVQQILRE